MFCEGCQSLLRILVCKYPVLLAQSVDYLLSIAPFSEITWLAVDLFLGFLLCPLAHLSPLVLLSYGFECCQFILRLEAI